MGGEREHRFIATEIETGGPLGKRQKVTLTLIKHIASEAA